MRHIISKTAVFALIFMMSVGNFAYAASAGFCKVTGSVSQSQKVMPCCKVEAPSCQCKITTVPKLFPQLAQSFPSHNFGLSVLGFTVLKSFTQDSSSVRRWFSSKSPPGQEPLFALYSSYRI